MFVGGIGLVWPIKSAVYAGAEYISCPKRREKIDRYALTYIL